MVKNPAMKVSVICTVLNEGESIKKLLKTLAQQTRPADEIIFVDGGSSDQTVAVLEAYAAKHQLPLQVMVAAGANISQGRNIAIEAAAGPIIASTDAGLMSLALSARPVDVGLMVPSVAKVSWKRSRSRTLHCGPSS